MGLSSAVCSNVQARGKPYVIVFCGVNGVGKSTNLAKIAYWLGGHGIKVTIAACDTFRAGAWQQARVLHGPVGWARWLDVRRLPQYHCAHMLIMQACVARAVATPYGTTCLPCQGR